MKAKSLRQLDLLSLVLLGLFLFFQAAYNKRFVYLSVSVGNFPIYISEILFLLLCGLRFRHWGELRTMPRWVWAGFGLYLAWGFARLAASVLLEKHHATFGLMETLKQTALFYQVVWLLIPFLFSHEDHRKLFSAGLAGIGFAQMVGWLGFLLMGSYGKMYSHLIGFPVGNEVLLPLYPLAYLIWPPAWAGLLALSFGQLWYTQFIIYMKRTWVFGVIVFSLPLLFWRARVSTWVTIKRLAIPFAIGMVLSVITVKFVANRETPPFHQGVKAEAAAQRAHFSPLARGLLELVDGIFPYTDNLDTVVPLMRIVFKGDFLEDRNKGSTSFMAFRWHLWWQAWAKFLERPWVGQGFGPHYAETQLNGLPAMVNGKWISGPHNSYLAILNRMGVVGGVCFAILLLSLLGYYARALLSLRLDTFGWILLVAFVSVNFFAFFNVCLENPQGGIWYWLFAGMALRSAQATAARPR